MNKHGLQIFKKLPTGWETTTLGEVLPILYGKGLTKAKRDNDGPYAVYGSSGQVGNHSKAITVRPALIIGRKGSVGEVYYSHFPCWPIDTTYYVEEKENLNLRFFEYLLKGLILSKLDKSTAIPGLSRGDYNNVQVAIAPLNEQKRIVAEIEKQFSRLDEAVENLKRVKANLKRYKTSVLKAAVEGKLINITKDNKTFHIEKWQPIDSALLSLDQGWSPKCHRQKANESEWGVIKTSAVQTLQFIEWENKRLPESLKPRQHLELQQNDLLVTRAGPRKRVGVCCLVRSTRSKLILCDKVYRLRCNHEVARPGYLELVLNAPQLKKAINEIKTGISDSGVNLTQKRFKALRIPLPNVELQMQIESEVQRLWSIVGQVTLNTTEGSARCQRLRQSILKKAFSGKLVAQVENDEFLLSSLK